MKAIVINYGVGNLFSISSALRRNGFEVEISNELKENTDLIVFPGVGSFSAVSKFINDRKEKINELLDKGISFLGVCLGMQIMFDEGTEGGYSKGLGWFKGKVDKINANVKLPHIGWDKIQSVRYSELTEDLDGRYAYFVHSYVAYTNDSIGMVSHYGIDYPVMVYKEKIVGTQFHPEKSSTTGKIFFSNLKRWLKL
ncbi:imidazole glycerol phosphate synthase subunit HisH [Acidianus sulfidivorans JP7]|uniref:Imidazole glycerol phosphate synthase subunit HisH n=1 Tax=Acidianus sulfidivorans JP7 TaxID=619593 RepID=A0A2U9INI5_9CREN|nr:imidazole glycerol phosphate synthase subunit HisH [Acidianus sulfidivorans]AWR97583.1 imidazole glycerol phosphate synthase subunit HisH [Acidianus sulfidivorans JP7]